MLKKLIIGLTILLPLSAEETPFPQNSPQEEYEILLSYGEESKALLSKAIADLIQGVDGGHFKSDFFEKIKMKEKEKFTGMIHEYWEDGAEKFRAELIEGIPNGHVHGYYPNTSDAFKAYFDKGTKTGIHLVFYPNNVPFFHYDPIARRFCFDELGRMNGEQESKYFKPPWLKVLISYKEGKLEGEKSLFDEDRKCLLREEYKKDKLTKKIT